LPTDGYIAFFLIVGLSLHSSRQRRFHDANLP
jgi:hypothetical protein